ncbi:MAG TPA: hypothetical protein PLS03_16225 [Terrimicrobiaceae bacterium]|nr:hypothetical protein [Terrimicrobiaceae bacterium]
MQWPSLHGGRALPVLAVACSFLADVSVGADPGESPKDTLDLLRAKIAASFGRQYEWKVDTVINRSSSDALALAALANDILEKSQQTPGADPNRIADFEQLKEKVSKPGDKQERMQVTARLVSPTLWRVTKALAVQELPDPLITTYLADGSGRCFEISQATKSVSVHEDARLILADLLASPMDMRLLDDLDRLQPQDCTVSFRPPSAEISYLGPRTGVRRQVFFDPGTVEVQLIKDVESGGKVLAIAERVSGRQVRTALLRTSDGTFRRKSDWTLVSDRDLVEYAEKEFQPEIPPTFSVEAVGRDGQRVPLSPEDVKGRKFQFGSQPAIP